MTTFAQAGSDLGAFVPADVRASLAGGAEPLRHRSGAVLEADLAGSTMLFERLARVHGPRRGAEAVAALLDRVYGALIDPVDRGGGTVVEFMGDAIACCFDGDDGSRALRCGLTMQTKIASLRVPGATSPAVKVSVATGDFLRFSVGDPAVRLMEVIAGPAIDRLAAIAPFAERGDVIADAHTVECLGARARIGSWRAGGRARCALVTGVSDVREDDGPPLRPLGRIDADVARPWLTAAVYERLRAGGEALLGELRSVVMMFLRFAEIDYGEPGAPERLDACARFAQTTIEGYGGTLLSMTVDVKGSYLCAGFGAPIAYDDDAPRAAAAALALRDAPASVGAAPDGVGLTSGRVYAGLFGGPTRCTFGLQGSKANLAARLMQSAHDGQILVEEPLARRLAARFDLRPLAPLQLAGVARAVPVRELAGPRTKARATQAPRSVRAGAQLVNRVAERRDLDLLVAALLEGKGAIVVLEGEPGIGKTRLIDDLTQRATDRGVQVYGGAGDPIERGAPYHGWGPVFRSALELDGLPDDAAARRELVLARLAAVPAAVAGDRAETLAPLLSAVAPVALPDGPATAGLTGEARAEATRDLLAATLAAMARDAPTLVVLEDAHWLDSASLALALRLASAGEPLLLVLTTRPRAEFATTELERVAAVAGCVHMSIGPLLAAESLQVATGAVGRRLPQAAAELITTKAGGNPLFTRELAYALRDHGWLERPDGDGRAPARAPLESPDTVESVIAGRFDRLPSRAQAVLKIASVLGLSLSAPALRELAGSAVDDELEQLERLDLLAPDGDGPEAGLRFRHALIRDVIYERLLQAQRRELHRRAAEYFEAAGGATHTTLAHHWERGGVADRAVEHLGAAGEDAFRADAARECADALGRALELTADEGPGGRRARWTFYVAQAHYRLGELDRAITLGADAIAALDRRVPERVTGVAGRTIVEIGRQGLHRALPGRLPRRADDERSTELRMAVEAHLTMTEVYYTAADTARTMYCAVRALNLAERLDPSTELAQCYGGVCIITGILGAHGVAERYADMSRVTAELIEDPYTVARTIHQVGMYRSSRGPYSSFAELYCEGIDALRRLERKPQLRDALGLAAIADHYFGRTGVAHGKLAELQATVEPQEVALWAQWAPIFLAAGALRQGRPNEALADLRRSALLIQAEDIDMPAVTIRALAALALQRTQRPGEARQQERAAWDLVRRLGRMPTSHAVLDGYTALAELALQGWDTARSPSARRRARRRAGRANSNLRVFALVFGIGAPARWLYRAELQWRRGRHQPALRSWRRCLGAAERLEMLHEQALAHAALADHLPSDSHDARRHRRCAAGLLRTLGAPPTLRAVAPALAAAPAPAPGTLALRAGPALEAIVAGCRARRSRAGYFAALQTHLPPALDAAVHANEFDDPEAVVRLYDALFQRHRDAWLAHERGAACPAAWAIAFTVGARREPHVAQHLLLGMNAHVALDLPVALAEAVGQERMTIFDADFERCGRLAGSLGAAVVADVLGGGPRDRLRRRAGSARDALAMGATRARAWEDGRRLAMLPGDARRRAIAALADDAAARARAIATPAGPTRWLGYAISVSERATVTAAIDDLRR